MIRIPQITIPRQPRSGLDVLAWAKDVNYALRQLANIKEDYLSGGGKNVNKGSIINANTSHPWKVTNGGAGNVYIAPGYVMGYYMDYTEDVWGSVTSGVINSDDSSPSQTLAAGYYYEGGTHAVSGTKFIYAEVIRNFPLVYAESGADSGTIYTEGELGNTTEPPDYDAETLEVTGVAAIVLSDDPPNTYVSTSGYSAVLIAKAVNVEGVISVTQYLTHNPTIFVPIIKILSSPSI